MSSQSSHTATDIFGDSAYHRARKAAPIHGVATTTVKPLQKIVTTKTLPSLLPSEASKSNPNVQSRATKDKLLLPANTSKGRRHILKKKEALYNSLKSGAAQGIEPSDEYLVSFAPPDPTDSDPLPSSECNPSPPAEYLDCLDEYGRTIQVLVGSSEWQRVIASNGMNFMQAELENDAYEPASTATVAPAARTSHDEKRELNELAAETAMARESVKRRREDTGETVGVSVLKAVVLPEAKKMSKKARFEALMTRKKNMSA